MHYDLTDLRLFVAVAEARNLTRGAHKVHLAPSSASHRISQLEGTLGTTLLRREARGVSLTEAGEALLRHARRVFAQLEQMHADLSPYAAGVRGHVSLWANTHATHTYLPHDLASFLRDQPQISVSLEEHTSQDIVLAVAQGEVDLGIVAEHVEGAQVELIPYRSDRLVLVVPGKHPLAARRCVKFAEVVNHPFVMLHAGSAIHTFTMNAASALGQHLNVRIQVRSFDAVCRMVGAGVGIGLVPHSAMTHLHLPTPPVVLDLDETWAPRDLNICIRQGHTLPRFAADLVNCLRSDRLCGGPQDGASSP